MCICAVPTETMCLSCMSSNVPLFMKRHVFIRFFFLSKKKGKPNSQCDWCRTPHTHPKAYITCQNERFPVHVSIYPYNMLLWYCHILFIQYAANTCSTFCRHITEETHHTRGGSAENFYNSRIWKVIYEIGGMLVQFSVWIEDVKNVCKLVQWMLGASACEKPICRNVLHWNYIYILNLRFQSWNLYYARMLKV